jgi:hypothetical protein
MKLSDHDLRQLDKEVIISLPLSALQNLTNRLLSDLKESRERLNQNSQNSSKPPSNEAPWDKASAHSYADADQNTDSEQPEPVTEDVALMAAMQTDGDNSNTPEDTLPEDTEQTPTSDNVAETPAAAPLVTDSVRKPGKQKGAKGYGRTQKLPVHRHQHHHPTDCACCSRTLDEAGIESNKAYTAFDSLGIEAGTPEKPGITVINTRHTYYETTCICGHSTRAVPFRHAPDSDLPRIELSEWRLVEASLASLIVCLSLRIRLSRVRIREFLDEWIGVTLSVGTINQTIHEAGRAVMPVEDMLVEEVLNSGLLYIDETSWNQKEKLLWLWAFVSTTVVLFRVQLNKRHQSFTRF